MRYLALLLLAALTACGNIYEDDRCTDFQYQEDAQERYRKGAKQLDPDGNGKACEELPPRPVAPPPPPPAATEGFVFTGSAGTTFIAQRSGDGYQLLSQSVSSAVSVTSSLTLAPRDLDGGSELARGDGAVLRYASGAGGAVAGWTAITDLDPAGTGLGLPLGDLAGLEQLAGDYKVLGQRCVQGVFGCAVVAATLRIASSGTVDICLATEFSPSCPTRERRTLKAAGMAENLWTLGRAGELLAGSRTQGTIAFNYWGGTGYFSFAGQRADRTLRTTSPPPESVWFDAAGRLQRARPALPTTSATVDRPLAGFYQDSVGNTYLRSESGQLVTWTSGSGLRHFVAR